MGTSRTKLSMEKTPFSSSNPPLFSLNETQPAHELSSLGALRAIWYLLEATITMITTKPNPLEVLFD